MKHWVVPERSTSKREKRFQNSPMQEKNVYHNMPKYSSLTIKQFVVLEINNHSLIVHLCHLAISFPHLVNAELITVSQNIAEVAKYSKVLKSWNSVDKL